MRIFLNNHFLKAWALQVWFLVWILVLSGSNFSVWAEDAATLAASATNGLPIAKIKHTGPVDFEKEVLPVLSRNCLACHNQTKAKADLILETPQTILKGGESGPAVVPKRSSESLLMQLASHQKKPLMPPKDNKVAAASLSADELGLIRLWIDQGAKGEVRGLGPVEWQSLASTYNPIFSTAVGRDGQYLACGRGNQIFIYHLPSARLVARLTDPQLVKAGIYAKAGVAHRDLVNALAFAPNGTLLASGGYREIKLWRHPQNVQRSSLNTGAAKNGRAFGLRSDRKALATVGDDSSLRLWDLTSGKLEKTLAGCTTPSRVLAYSPDGKLLLSISADKPLALWQVSDGKLLAQPTNLDAAEFSVATWVDAQRFAVGGTNQVIQVWQWTEGTNGGLQRVQELTGPAAAISALAGGVANGNILVSGDANGGVRIWDLKNAKTTFELQHGGGVAGVAVRSDGKRIASVGTNGIAKLWDAKTGALVAEMKGDRYAMELVPTREREAKFAQAEVDYRQSMLRGSETNLIASTDRLTKAATTNESTTKVLTEKKQARDMAGERRLASEQALADLSGDLKKTSDTIDIVSKAAGDKPPAETDEAVKSAQAAKSALEKFLASLKTKEKQAREKTNSVAKEFLDADKEFKRIELIHAATEHELELAVKGAQRNTNACEEAKFMLATAEDQRKHADASSADARKAAAASVQPIDTVSFSPDNLVLASAGDDGVIHTWSADTGAAFECYRGQNAPVGKVVAGTGSLVSVSDDGRAIVWELNPPWQLERVIGTGDERSPLVDRVNALRFSPDGKFLASGGGEPSRAGEIKLWDAATGQLSKELKNIHSDTVLALDFSPDGKLLASGAADKFARVTDIASGKVLKVFEGHTHHVMGVSWKHDGRTLATAGADTLVKFWDVVSGERRKNVEGATKEITAIQFLESSDLALATSGDGQVRLLNEKGEKVRAFEGNAEFQNCGASTPDGQLVVAAGVDGVMRVWNGHDGKLIDAFSMPDDAAASR